MAFPYRNKEDYEAMKSFVVKDIMHRTPEEKERAKKNFEDLNLEIYISDDELKESVNQIFAQEYRLWAYQTLLEAKNNLSAKRAYFNFINAYKKTQQDNSSGNVCCMSVDLAMDLLKKKKKARKK